MDKPFGFLKILLLTFFYGVPVTYLIPYLLDAMGLAIKGVQLTVAGGLRGIDIDTAVTVLYSATIAAYFFSALFLAILLALYLGFMQALIYSYRFAGGFSNFLVQCTASTWFFTLALAAPPMMEMLDYWESIRAYYDFYLWALVFVHILIQHQVHMKTVPVRQ